MIKITEDEINALSAPLTGAGASQVEAFWANGFLAKLVALAKEQKQETEPEADMNSGKLPF